MIVVITRMINRRDNVLVHVAIRIKFCIISWEIVKVKITKAIIKDDVENWLFINQNCIGN